MSLPTFVTAEAFAAGKQVTLGEDAAHHMRVRRLAVGTHVALLDGHGTRGTGVLVRVVKRNATVEVDTVSVETQPRPVHLLLPIADKERMLWLAEKVAELGAASWRPVQFRRSRSVAARGEGTMFTQKVGARMIGALEQSGSAWLPAIFPDATVERAIAAAPEGIRIVLDGAGPQLASLSLGSEAGVEGADGEGGRAPSATDVPTAPPIVLVVGPEGGIEPDELARFTDAGFRVAAVGHTILRFETAAVAALGVVQSLIGRAGVLSAEGVRGGADGLPRSPTPGVS